MVCQTATYPHKTKMFPLFIGEAFLRYAEPVYNYILGVYGRNLMFV